MAIRKPFHIRKIADEGTSEPFMARLFLGIVELRDAMLACSGVTGEAHEQRRAEFDVAYKAVFTPLEAARAAAKSAVTLMADHASKVRSGAIVTFQPNAFTISETIDITLHDAVSRLLIQGVIALKKLQPLTQQFGLEIGGFFQKSAGFQDTVDTLRLDGHATLGDYLVAARAAWSEEFIALRTAIEHDGWTLPPVSYEPCGPHSVVVREPEIGDVSASEYIKLVTRRLLAFVETVTAYVISTALRGVRLVEIPERERDPNCARRFRVDVVGSQSPWAQGARTRLWLPNTAWSPRFSDDDFRW